MKKLAFEGIELEEVLNKDNNKKKQQKLEFKSDVIPSVLKKKSIVPLSLRQKSVHSEISDNKFFSIGNIILSALISISFYSLLIDIILQPDALSIVLFVLITLVGFIAQSQVIPEKPWFSTKYLFEFYLEDILNAYAKIKIGDLEERVEFTSSYTIDLTGKLVIPNDINLAKFGEIICYTDDSFYEFCDKYKVVYDCEFLGSKAYYYYSKEDFEVKYYDEIFSLNDSSKIDPVNCITFILCLLFLQWIQATYYYLTWKMVIINPVKLVTEEYICDSPTRINTHGKIYKAKDCEIVDEMEERYEEIMEERRRKNEKMKKEQQEKERQKYLEERKRERQQFLEEMRRKKKRKKKKEKEKRKRKEMKKILKY